MDIKSMTYIELFKLYHQIGFELAIRTWYIGVLLIVFFAIFFYKIVKK